MNVEKHSRRYGSGQAAHAGSPRPDRPLPVRADSANPHERELARLLMEHKISMEKRRKQFVFTTNDGKRVVVEHAIGDFTIQSNIVNNVRRLLK